jgi:RNA polymerase primary sigma factor
VDRFDYRVGAKFGTYATYWIRQTVLRAISDHSRTIRIPVHKGDQVQSLMRERARLTQELGREPPAPELAKAMDIPLQKVDDLYRLAQDPLSLDMAIGADGEAEFGDLIEDARTVKPDSAADASALRTLVADILDDLPAREAQVLRLRYGLVDGEQHVLEEIGRRLGVSRERARQIEVRALSRLRHPAHARRLREFIELS